MHDPPAGGCRRDADPVALGLETGLVAACRRGDPGALERLAERFQAAVFGTALCLVGDRDAALEVTGATLFKLSRSLDRYDPARPLRPWVLQIATDESLHWLRARRREHQRLPGSEADAAASLRVPPLPVYRCGTAADPLPNGSDDRPEPVAWQYPPYEVAQRLLPDGFAILVRGGAMAGWRPDPVLDGDVGWVVPASREPPRHRGLAVLRIETEDTRHQGLRVRSYVRGEDGRAEAWAHPEGAERYRIPASRVDVVGRVVRLERLRSPDG